MVSRTDNARIAVDSPVSGRMALKQIGTTWRFRRYAYGFLGLALAVLGYLLYSRPHTITLEQALLGAVITLLGFVPGIVYLLRGAREPIPLLALHGLFYSFTFGLPVLSADLEWHLASEYAITTALWLTVVGLCVLYGAYFLAGQLLFARLRPFRLGHEASRPRLIRAAWLFMAAHLLYQYSPPLQDVPSIGHYLYPLGWVAIALLYWLYLSGDLPRLHAIPFFFVALPLEFLVRFTSGALAAVLILLLFMMLIYWQVRKRISWSFIVIITAIFLIFNPIKQEYRAIVWYGQERSADYGTKAELFVQLAFNRYLGTSQNSTTSIRQTNINRLGHIATFSHVVQMTPDLVPFWGGETYGFFLARIVPRILWPDKPTFSFGNKFGQRYRLLARDDFTTSYNLPWLPEFYANFGTWGIVFGMALVGIAFRFLVGKFSHPRASVIEYVLGLTLVFQLFYAESNLALMWGGLVLTFIALYVTMSLCTRRLRG